MAENTQLKTCVSEDGTAVELRLEKSPIPELQTDEVLVRIEAAPINPSDIGLLIGAANAASVTKAAEKDGLPACSMEIPEKVRGMYAARKGTGLTAGNEGAGVVVKAGSSSEAQLLNGCLVGIMGGACFGEYKVIKASMCLAFPEGVTAAQAASWFVNPMTALGFTENMKMEGHKAIVATAAASNLGQMLAKICIKDGIDLISIVRKADQVDILKALGVKYVLNSTSETFEQELVDACKATGATIAFDAIGSGDMCGKILTCMEKALTAESGAGVYGSSTKKQVYIYGKLGSGPVALGGSFGLAWGVGGWLLFPFLNKAGPDVAKRMKERVAAEITTIFASSYVKEVSLAEAVDPETVKLFSKQATGEKVLIKNAKP
jgi:NADPH2:quinone reductase